MKRIFVLFFIIAILLSSCNMPASDTVDPQVATAAALTVEAVIGNSTPLASPTAGSQANTEATPTYSQPLASFEDVTNCRTGPGVNYERVTQILPADSVEIIGFYPPNYWIVSTDNGPCWVSGEFVTPSGSIAAVPTVTAPPTPQGSAPDNVSLQSWFVSCNYVTNEANVTIAWSDKDDESGYRVFRNNQLIAELPENSREFKETISLLSGQSVGYYVVAFNAVGSTSSKSISMSC
ncbi:MAG: SH3 domain-containing protein [Anaerolineales bacterium]|nr:SH3 domain-containing protein [Anaerolineales bacterium]